MEAHGQILEAVLRGDVEALNINAASLQTWIDGKGASLLHHAVNAQATNVCGLLLAKGLAAGALDGSKRTPLHLAGAQGNEDIALMLIENGASADVVDTKGRTPQDYASAAGHEDCAQLLRNWRVFASRPGNVADLWDGPGLVGTIPEIETQFADELPALEPGQRRRIVLWLEQGMNAKRIADVEMVQYEQVISLAAECNIPIGPRGDAPQKPPKLERSISDKLGRTKVKTVVGLLQRAVSFKEIASICNVDIQDIMRFVSNHTWEKIDAIAVIESLLAEPPEYCDPILMTLMTDPVIASDGFVYERESIARVLRDSAAPRSPKTNLCLPNSDLVPAVFWRTQIFNYLENTANSALALLPRIVDQGFADISLQLCAQAALFLEKLGGPEKYRRKYTSIIHLWCRCVMHLHHTEGGSPETRIQKLFFAFLGIPQDDRPVIADIAIQLGLPEILPQGKWSQFEKGIVIPNSIHTFERSVQQQAAEGRLNWQELDEAETAAYLRQFNIQR